MVRIGKRSRAGCACLVAALCICIADEGGSPRLGLTARPRDATQLMVEERVRTRKVLASWCHGAGNTCCRIGSRLLQV